MPAAQGPLRVKPKSRGRRPPKSVVPSAHPPEVFGGLQRADAGILRAQRAAHQSTQRARRHIEARTVVPYVPKLAHPTSGQRGAAQSIVARGLRRQGIRTAAEVQALPPAQRARVHRAQGYARTNVKRSNAAAAAAQGRHAATLTALAALGQALRAQRGDGYATGDQHKRVGLPFGVATIDLSNLSRSLVDATSLNTGDLGPRDFLKHAAGDVGALGTAPFVGGYELGAGAVDVVRHGDTRRLRELAKGIGHGISTSVPGELVQGHPGRAAESFRQHPVFGALDLAAVAGAAGSAAGAVARGAGTEAEAGGLRGALGRAGSTVRPPLALSEDAGAGARIVHEREYSKDSIRKAGQVAADARREPLTDAEGRVVTVVQRGRRVPVLKASPAERERLLRRRGDFSSSRANAAERLTREQAPAELAGRVTRKPRAVENDLSTLVTEGTIRSGERFAGDLAKHRDRIEAALKEHDRRVKAGEPSNFRHTGELETAQNQAALLTRALKSPREIKGLEKVVAAGYQNARHLNALESEAVRLGLIPAHVARRAKLIPWAIAHMGARHVTVEEHAALEQTARQAEQAAAAKARALPKGPQRDAALADWRRARSERIAVSGRDPRGVRAHEQKQASHAAAELRAKQAEAQVARLERSRQRVIGAQAVRRGTGAKTATKGARALANIDANLKRARATAQAARTEARKARHEAQASKLPDIHEGVRTRDGRFLSNAEIEADIRRQRGPDGLDTIAYLPHRLDVRGNRAYHTQFRLGTRPVLDKQSRTGALYARGATEIGARVAHDEAVHKATQIAKAQQLDRALQAHAIRHPAWAKSDAGEALTGPEKRIVAKGGAFTAKEAVETAERILHDTGERLVPVRLYGARLSQETQRRIREDFQNPSALESIDQRLLNDRIVHPGDSALDKGSRNVALVPAAYVEQLDKHLRPAGDIRRFVQFLNRPFRAAVLPQPRWLAGNFVEPFLVRLPTVGSGVNVFGLGLDISAAVKTLRRMERSGDPALRHAAHELRGQHLGGLFVGGRTASVRRTFEEAMPAGLRAPYGRMVETLPVVGQMVEAGHAATAFLAKPLQAFFRVNRVIEGSAQRAALGRSIRRDVQAFTGSWLASVRLGEKAVDDAARGLVGTAAQHRFLNAQHELLGKYDGYSPAVRELIQGPMPFLPWAMSAARFVFWTMPVHRTVTTAVLLKTQQAVSQAWADQHKDAPPGELQLAARTKDGGLVDLARYTPYGFSAPIVAGDYQGVVNEVLPQLTGAAQALGGKDPFGRDLRVKPTKGNPSGIPTGGDKAKIAVNSLLEAVIPYLATGRRLQEGGATAYSDSTIVSPKTKPGTSHGMGALERTFSPLRPTYLRRGQTAPKVSPANEAQSILAGSRGHVTRLPSTNEAQEILARSRRP